MSEDSVKQVVRRFLETVNPYHIASPGFEPVNAYDLERFPRAVLKRALLNECDAEHLYERLKAASLLLQNYSLGPHVEFLLNNFAACLSSEDSTTREIALVAVGDFKELPDPLVNGIRLLLNSDAENEGFIAALVGVGHADLRVASAKVLNLTMDAKRNPAQQLQAAIGLIRAGCFTERAWNKVKEFASAADSAGFYDELLMSIGNVLPNSTSAKELRGLAATPGLSVAAQAAATKLLATADSETLKTHAFLKAQLRSTNWEIVYAASHALFCHSCGIDAECQSVLVSHLSTQKDKLRHASVTALQRCCKNLSMATINKLAKLLVVENDMQVFEKLVEACVSEGEKSFEALVDAAANANGFRKMWLIAAVVRLGYSSRSKLIEMVADEELDEDARSLVAGLLSAFQIAGDNVEYHLQTMLLSNDAEQKRLGLVAMARIGGLFSGLMPVLIDILDNVDARLSQLSRQAIESIGVQGIPYIDSHLRDSKNSILLRLREVIQAKALDSGNQALSWVGNPDLIYKFVVISDAIEELGGAASLNQIADNLRQKIEGDGLDTTLKLGRSTLQNVVVELERQLSSSWGRRVHVFEKVGKKSELSPDAKAFLLVARAYVADSPR